MVVIPAPVKICGPWHHCSGPRYF